MTPEQESRIAHLCRLIHTDGEAIKSLEAAKRKKADELGQLLLLEGLEKHATDDFHISIGSRSRETIDAALLVQQGVDIAKIKAATKTSSWVETRVTKKKDKKEGEE